MNLPFEGYLRRKDAYEAADAALVLWRKNFSYFIIFFAIPFWICAFTFRMLPGKWQYLSWVFMWFLKPFFDRLILHIISIKFFEGGADFKRLFKGLGETLRRGLAGDLLWRRFSPFRSAAMPIRVLEPAVREKNKKTNKYAERKKLLNKGGLGYCFLLTFWGLSLEAALLLGEFLFITMMSYSMGIGFVYFSAEFIINTEIYFYALWCINYILVESIYVCMGFGVYINSRIEVEGWDIEIMFKGFAEKLKKKKAIGVLFFLCFISVFLPAEASAQSELPKDTELSGVYDNVPLEILEEVLSSPDFGYEKDSWKIREKNPKVPQERIIIINKSRDNFIRRLANIIASGLRIILIISIITAAIIVFIFVRRYYKRKNFSVIEKPGLTIIQENRQNNPQELLEKAICFFNLGGDKENLRYAWGYCVAAAILFLNLNRSLNFPPNSTENDCAKIAGAGLKKEEEIASFKKIIKNWTNYVYAGRLPPDGGFEEAVSFCKLLSIKEEGTANG